jgi:NADP-dependent aldehyde dehydrogenase
VVLPGAAFARPAAIATGYTGSLTLGTGQFCTNPGLLFVPEDVGLLSAIAEAVGASAGGAMLTGRIFAGFEEAVEEAAEHAGVTELAAGQPGPGPWGATPRVFQLTLKEFADDIAILSRERFGPAGLVITYPSVEDLLPVLAALSGNLVGTVQVDTASPEDIDLARQVVEVLQHIAGRVVCNGWPTGVAVVAAQHHGGPWPATTAPASTSVGTAAIRRWLVPVAYQDFPPELLPAGLRLPAHFIDVNCHWAACCCKPSVTFRTVPSARSSDTAAGLAAVDSEVQRAVALDPSRTARTAFWLVVFR